MEDILKKLQEEELATLEGKKYGVEEKYQRMPAMVSTVAKNMGIDPDLLVKTCAQTSVHYQDLEWNNILEIVYMFHRTKARIEKSK